MGNNWVTIQMPQKVAAYHLSFTHSKTKNKKNPKKTMLKTKLMIKKAPTPSVLNNFPFLI